jgi:hypothetical protein
LHFDQGITYLICIASSIYSAIRRTREQCLKVGYVCFLSSHHVSFVYVANVYHRQKTSNLNLFYLSEI